MLYPLLMWNNSIIWENGHGRNGIHSNLIEYIKTKINIDKYTSYRGTSQKPDGRFSRPISLLSHTQKIKGPFLKFLE